MVLEMLRVQPALFAARHLAKQRVQGRGLIDGLRDRFSQQRPAARQFRVEVVLLMRDERLVGGRVLWPRQVQDDEL